MIFAWIFAVSLVLYIYYSMRINARLIALHTADLGPNFRTTPSGVAGAQVAPPVAPAPPAPATAPEPEREHDYIDMEALNAQTVLRGPHDIPTVHMARSGKVFSSPQARASYMRARTSSLWRYGHQGFERDPFLISKFAEPGSCASCAAQSPSAKATS